MHKCLYYQYQCETFLGQILISYLLVIHNRLLVYSWSHTAGLFLHGLHCTAQLCELLLVSVCSAATIYNHKSSARKNIGGQILGEDQILSIPSKTMKKIFTIFIYIILCYTTLNTVTALLEYLNLTVFFL